MRAGHTLTRAYFMKDGVTVMLQGPGAEAYWELQSLLVRNDEWSHKLSEKYVGGEVDSLVARTIDLPSDADFGAHVAELLAKLRASGDDCHCRVFIRGVRLQRDSLTVGRATLLRKTPEREEEMRKLVSARVATTRGDDDHKDACRRMLIENLDRSLDDCDCFADSSAFGDLTKAREIAEQLTQRALDAVFLGACMEYPGLVDDASFGFLDQSNCAPRATLVTSPTSMHLDQRKNSSPLHLDDDVVERVKATGALAIGDLASKEKPSEFEQMLLRASQFLCLSQQSEDPGVRLTCLVTALEAILHPGRTEPGQDAGKRRRNRKRGITSQVQNGVAAVMATDASLVMGYRAFTGRMYDRSRDTSHEARVTVTRHEIRQVRRLVAQVILWGLAQRGEILDRAGMRAWIRKRFEEWGLNDDGLPADGERRGGEAARRRPEY